MIVAFILSMPNNNAWNGKWSGEGNLYVVFHKFTGVKGKQKAERILANRSYYYNFGDGWGASVSVKEVTSAEKTAMAKKSAGFCGYEWMVTSILDHGKIFNDIQQKELSSASL